MYRMFYIFICILLLNSCYSSIHVKGSYQTIDTDSILLVLSDSTFQYHKSARVWWQASSGNWFKDGRRITLTSNHWNKPRVDCGKTRREGEQKDVAISIEIDVADEYKQNYCCICCIVNGQIIPYNFDFERGDSFFKSECSVDSFALRICKVPTVYRGAGTMKWSDFVVTETVRPRAVDGDSLHIIVHVEDSFFHYKAFEKEEFKIRRRSLVSLRNKIVYYKVR